MAAVSLRYARAFADVLFAHKLDSATALRELSDVAELVGSNVTLRRVWENPAIPASQKIALLDAIVQRTAYSKEARNLLAVIIQHRRVALLPQIVRQLQQEIDSRQGVTEAQITVARALAPEDQRELEAQIARASGGGGVRATYSIEPALLGGASVRIGSTVYDGSVKGQLRKIKEALANT
jgi:F-type H+-transporting ATPase subunit delta